MGAPTGPDLIEALEKFANGLGILAWLVSTTGVVAGLYAATDVDGATSGFAVSLFMSTSGSYLIAAAGFMIARAVTLLALVTAEGD